MSKRKNSSSESSSSSNKKRHVNDDAILTDKRYDELYKYYCKPWDQINAESGGGTLRKKRQPPRMRLMKRVYKEMMKAHKKRDKTDAKNILYRFDKWYESGARYPLQRPRDWFQKLLTGVDNDNVDCDDEVIEVINLADGPDESNTIDLETWVLECIMLDVVKPEGGDDGSNNLVVKSEVGGNGDDGELDVEHDSPFWEKCVKEAQKRTNKYIYKTRVEKAKEEERITKEKAILLKRKMDLDYKFKPKVVPKNTNLQSRISPQQHVSTAFSSSAVDASYDDVISSSIFNAAQNLDESYMNQRKQNILMASSRIKFSMSKLPLKYNSACVFKIKHV